MNPLRILQDHPRLLEHFYRAAERLFLGMRPAFARLGFDRADRWMRPGEDLAKRLLFDCRMCGQCILHSTGMTCPMTCPKDLRNGPCGGVRDNGHCEVTPEMRCVWVEAFERSQHMPIHGSEILMIQPPVNRLLEGSSAWVNMLTETDMDVPKAWEGTSSMPVIKLEEISEWKKSGIDPRVA